MPPTLGLSNNPLGIDFQLELSQKRRSSWAGVRPALGVGRVGPDPSPQCALCGIQELRYGLWVYGVLFIESVGDGIGNRPLSGLHLRQPRRVDARLLRQGILGQASSNAPNF